MPTRQHGAAGMLSAYGATIDVDSNGKITIVPVTGQVLALTGPLNVTGNANTFTGTAVAAGAVTLTITPGAHTAVIAEKNDMKLAAHTITITAGTTIATVRSVYLAATTANGVVLGNEIITDGYTLSVDPFFTGTTMQVTNTHGLSSGAATSISGVATSTYDAILVPAHTVTDLSATGVTSACGVAGLRINQITVTSATNPAISQAASLYVANAPVAGGTATITNTYAVFVDVGVSRFDGNVVIGNSGESATLTMTSTDASALTVGRQGATNPVLKINAATAVVVTGVEITGGSNTNGADIAVIGSGLNENLRIASKGTGFVALNSDGTSQLAAQPAVVFASNQAANSRMAITLKGAASAGTVHGHLVLSTSDYAGGANAVANSGSITVASRNAADSEFRYCITSDGSAYTNVFSVASTGKVTVTGQAVAAGSNTLLITPGAHTAVVAEVIDISIAAHTATITGAITTQRSSNIAQPTYSAAAALAITTGATLAIAGTPNPTGVGPATITNAFGLMLGTALNTVPAYVASNATTITNAAMLYVANAPATGGNVTVTNPYAIWVDDGVTRLDGNVTGGGSILSSNATGGVGYKTGAGGTVTQITSKATGVTLNTVCGQITMNNANLGATTSVSFTLTNSTIATTDVVLVNIANAGAGATANSYFVSVDAVGAGSCSISLRNYTAGALAEAVVLNFAVIKAVTA